MLFLKKIKQYFAKTLQVNLFKNDVYFLHGRKRKGTLVSKSHFFYDINHNTEPLFINCFVCLKMLLATVI